jgi:hypothetical protein
MVPPLARRQLKRQTCRLAKHDQNGDRIMKYQRTILLFALCTAISACDMPDTTMANGGITLNDNVVTLHVKGSPDAIIDSSGDLHIDDKTVSTTPSQRGLLMLYYQNVNDVHDTGKEMGVASRRQIKIRMPRRVASN